MIKAGLFHDVDQVLFAVQEHSPKNVVVDHPPPAVHERVVGDAFLFRGVADEPFELRWQLGERLGSILAGGTRQVGFEVLWALMPRFVMEAVYRQLKVEGVNQTYI